MTHAQNAAQIELWRKFLHQQHLHSCNGMWANTLCDLALQAIHASQEAGQRVSVPLDILSALVEHNDNARSFFQIANRVATEFGTHALSTNFGGFAEATHKMLTKWHPETNQARAMLAAAPTQEGKP